MPDDANGALALSAKRYSDQADTQKDAGKYVNHAPGSDLNIRI